MIDESPATSTFFEPIALLGIAGAEIVLPSSLGPKARYSVPIKLSCQPPSGWADLFLQVGEISLKGHHISICGDRVIVNGTTVEMIGAKLKKALQDAAKMANLEYPKMLKEYMRRDATVFARQRRAKMAVEEEAGAIEFDAPASSSKRPVEAADVTAVVRQSTQSDLEDIYAAGIGVGD